ncbi:MAG: NADH-quinone oxidoreductase subunit NuoE [Chloroflexi bacterium]|nr:MAG: NADH-quinone oxidoreductase subunit NuoE [Chloroflexota bacterium]
MLSETERHEIEAEMKNYADPQAVSIDALRIVQRHRGGWVSDEAIHDLAEFLHMTPAELDGIATFYNLIFREPVGRHVIMLCNSVSCWVMGYDRVRARLKETLGVDFGGTTPDGRFTLLPIVCLGICDHAPAMMIDEDTYTDLKDDKVEEALRRYS